MAEKINLRSSKVKEQKRRVSEYGTETPLPSTAVERGTTRWLDGSTVIINGHLGVSGTAAISGVLNVSGATTLSGVTTIAGPTGITGALTIQGATTISGKLDVTGPTTLAGTLDITGNTNITGTLGIKGDTTLTGNMDVTGGGKIKIGTNMTLTPATDGGAITFQGGAKVSSVGGTVSMSGAGGVSSIVAGLTSVGMSSGDAHYVAFNDGSWDMGTTAAGLVSMAGGVQVRGNLTVPGTAAFNSTSAFTGIATFNASIRNPGRPTTGAAANVHMNASGYFYEVTSSKRFKIDVQTLDLPDSLLDVPIVDWIDRPAQENHDRLDDAPRPFEYEDQVDYDNADLTRIPGALAEDVEAAGGQAFVTFGEDGRPRALAYDRFALARTALLYDRIVAIEDHLKNLTYGGSNASN